MKTRDLQISSLILAVVFTIFAFAAEARLAPGAQLPVHWNASGQPDGYAPALRALLLPAAIVLGLAALFSIIPRLEPLQERLEASAPVLRTSWAGLLALITLVEVTIGAPAWGIDLPVNTITAGIGGLFLLIGNVLPKSRPGFFVGIRTPWTITDTDNWIATHRLGGKLLMTAGALIALASVLPLDAQALGYFVIGAIAISVLVPLVYSWWYWQSHKNV